VLVPFFALDPYGLVYGLVHIQKGIIASLITSAQSYVSSAHCFASAILWFGFSSAKVELSATLPFCAVVHRGMRAGGMARMQFFAEKPSSPQN
jgi:hypothetical protein